MTISAARLAANRANAAKSTGPKTEAGKARSRANALKHGLCATVVPIADEATIQARAVGVIATVCPQTEYQLWLCNRIAVTTIKLDQLDRVEHQTRAEASYRAEFEWDEVQRVEADRIAARLARQPAQTLSQLRRSVAGCDWLIHRWSHLADSAEQQPWTPEQRTLAHDLLATPPEFRGKSPTRQLDRQGRVLLPELTEREFARAQLVEWHHRRDAVRVDDEIAQLRATADLDDLGNRDLARLRRYERALLNDLNTAFAASQHELPHAVTNPRLLRSIPVQFFTSPTSPVPNEPKPEVAANEAKPEPVVTAENEPKLEAVIVAANEPRTTEVGTKNEPKPGPSPQGRTDLCLGRASGYPLDLPELGLGRPGAVARVYRGQVGQSPVLVPSRVEAVSPSRLRRTPRHQATDFDAMMADLPALGSLAARTGLV